MVEQSSAGSTKVTPIARYAERECGDCGIILPANQMVRLNDKVLAGYTKSRRRYASTRGTFGSGGTTSERYRIEATDVCPTCLETRREASKRSRLGTIVLFGVGILAAALLYAFATRGTSSATSDDTSSSVPGTPQDQTASPQDQPSSAATADSSAEALPTDAAQTSTPNAAETSSPELPSAGELAQARGTITDDSNPPAAVDCSGAASVVISMICNDAGLRGQDVRLVPIYHTLLERATPDQRVQFAQEQKAWISQRDACDTQSCLAAAYHQRLRVVTSEAWKQYNARNGDDPNATSPPRPPSPQKPILY